MFECVCLQVGDVYTCVSGGRRGDWWLGPAAWLCLTRFATVCCVSKAPALLMARISSTTFTCQGLHAQKCEAIVNLGLRPGRGCCVRIFGLGHGVGFR